MVSTPISLGDRGVSCPVPRSSTARVATHVATQRLRRLVRQFTQTDEYHALQRLAYVIEAGEELDSSDYVRTDRERRSYQRNQADLGEQARSLDKLIHRYPYLYPYCLGGEHSSEQEFEAIRHLQAERQRKFECELSRYVTHLIQQSNSSSRTSATAKNPTLLGDTELKATIKHFTGRVEGNSSYRDLARRFSVMCGSQKQSYRAFKEGLYQYLVASIEQVQPNYGKHHFNQWLYTQLKNTLPQSDTQTLNSFLVKRTCHHLIEALVSTPQNVTNHVVFIDLINNVGATVTVGLFLKLLLLYNNLKSGLDSLKSNLEKRFSVLYTHYEPVKHGVEWLVESLENLQIAFSIHFGSIDFPCMSQL
ncbi:MAG: hypothetical protein HC866_22280 [Leptolyngbyaceae cyanobacterium RU_5_1]|nr:hypothetical protein [Leptolyngbyaceae cyanobacterium RU_5_1]